MELAEQVVEGAAPAPAPAAPDLIRPEAGYVAVTDGTKVQLLPEQNLARAAEAGYRPATHGEYEAERQGVTGAIGAGAASALRGLTFGASDVAAVEASRALGGEAEAGATRRLLQSGREAHPDLSMGGEIAGSLAGMFLLPGGGAGAAARGETFAARAASRVAGAAPRAFAEGAAVSMGQQLTEDTLGDHDKSAQKYLTVGVEGGILGVLLAGGFAAGGGAIADRLALRGGRAAAEAVEGTVYRTAAKAEGRAAAVAEREANPVARLAEEQAFKGTGAKLKDWQKLGATQEQATERAQRIGRTLIDEGVTTPGATIGKQAERLTAKVRVVGEELGALRKTLDTAQARPSAENVLRRIESEVVAPLVATPFSAPEQSAIRTYVAEIASRAGGKTNFASFDELYRLRRALDAKLDPKLWSKVPGSAPPAAQELGKIRGILESEYEAAAERAAHELGTDVADKYRIAKAKFADLKTAEKIATKEAARAGSNRAVSLTDTIMAAAGFATLGPSGLAAAVANKAVRTYGNQVAAHVLDRVSRIESVAGAATKFDEKLRRGVAGFFGDKAAPKLKPKPSGTEYVTPETLRALREAVRNPSALTERVADQLEREGLAEAAPRVTRALAGAIMRAAAFAGQRLPKEPPPSGLNFAPQPARALPAMDQARAEAVVKALDQDAMLDDFARGHIDRQAIEALKIISPHVFDDVKGAFRDYAMANQPEMTVQQEVALSIIFGEAMTPLMQPATVRGFQQAFAQAPGPQQSAGAPRQTGPSKLHTATGTDRLESGEGEL